MAPMVMTGRDLTAVDKARRKLLDANPGSTISSLLCDGSDERSVRDAFQAVFKEFRRLDVLVSDAGILDGALIGMVSTAQIKRIFETNTYGVLHCAQYATRLMARSKTGSIKESFMGMAEYIGAAIAASSGSGDFSFDFGYYGIT